MTYFEVIHDPPDNFSYPSLLSELYSRLDDLAIIAPIERHAPYLTGIL